MGTDPGDLEEAYRKCLNVRETCQRRGQEAEDAPVEGAFEKEAAEEDAAKKEEDHGFRIIVS